MSLSNAYAMMTAPADAPHTPAIALLRSSLARLSLFQGLSGEVLDEIARAMTIRQQRAGALLCAQRQPGQGIHFLQSGRAKVSVLGESGREVILHVLRPGDFFGEMSLLDGGAQSADVIALGSVTLATLPRDAFHALTSRHASIALGLVAELSRRLRAADEAIVNLSIYEVHDRLVRTLVQMARRDGEETDEGLLIRRRPTQQDLAGMVGSCRETVSRAFSALARRGLLEMRGRSLVLSRQLVEMGGSRA